MARLGLMRSRSRMWKRLGAAKPRSTGARSLACAALARFSNPLWPFAFGALDGGAHGAAGTLVSGVCDGFHASLGHRVDDPAIAGRGQIVHRPGRPSPRNTSSPPASVRAWRSTP